MTLGKTIAALVSVTIAVTSTAAAQSTTAFKTGERTKGLTKECYYESLGNQHTETLRSFELCQLSVAVRSTIAPTLALATTMATSFKTGERTTGLTKLCFYNGLSSEYTKTIKSIGLCPLSIWMRPQL
jgi:hypothetical protein